MTKANVPGTHESECSPEQPGVGRDGRPKQDSLGTLARGWKKPLLLGPEGGASACLASGPLTPCCSP